MGKIKCTPACWSRRKVFVVIFSLAIAVSAIGTLIWFQFSGFGFAARNASNLIGQTTSTGAIDYTAALVNNVRTPNAMGFSTVSDAVVDEVNHRLFVSDYSNRRVLVYDLDASNTIQDRTADYVLGQSDFNSNGSYANTEGRLIGPTSLAFDPASSTLYVVDGVGTTKIVIFDVSTITNGESAIYNLGALTLGGSIITSGTSSVSYASGLAVDTVGRRLFVAQDNGFNRVSVFDISSIANGETAVNVLGQVNFASSTATSTQSGLNYPSELAFDSTSNTLYVVDGGNNRVLVFDVAEISNGENAINVLGQTNFTNRTSAISQAGMGGPEGIAIDEVNKYLYVSGYTFSSGARITVYSVAEISNGENAINVLGDSDFVGTSFNEVSQRSIRNASYLALSTSTDKLFVSQQSARRVSVFDVASITDGENAVDLLGQIDGDGQPIYNTSYADNTQPSAGSLRGSETLEIDKTNHRLFVSDYDNHRVLVYNLDSSDNLVDGIADYVLGQSNFYGSSASTSQGRMNYPTGLLYDSVGNVLFVSDASNNRILIFDVSTITTGENAINVLGQTNFVSSDAATTQAGLYFPMGLAFDTARNYLFVVDDGNSRVVVFDVSSITDGENAINVLGQANFTSSNAVTTQAGLQYPTGASFDSNRNYLYILDGSNSRVVVYDVTAITDGEDAINVLGQANFVSAGTATTQSGLNYPFYIDYDSDNRLLYIADTTNNRVVIYDVDSITDGENAIGVLGQDDFTTASSATTQSGLYEPRGVLVDNVNGTVYAADTNNNRIIIYRMIDIGSDTPGSTVINSNYEFDVSVTSSLGTVTYSVFSGTLPPGLTLGTSTGFILGHPTSPGTYSFTIQATDGGSNAGNIIDKKSYTIVVNDVPQGMPILGAAYSAPSSPATSTQNPTGEFKMIINNGSKETSSANVGLSFVAGNDTAKMAISNDPDFKDAIQVPYSPTTTWNICSGECKEGGYVVYVKFFTAHGQSSEAVKSSIKLTSRPVLNVEVITVPVVKEGNKIVKIISPIKKAIITKTLKYGSKGPEVKALQNYLKTKGFFKFKRVTDYYGYWTRMAVKAFQKKNKLKVTGIVDEKTRAMINK